MKRLFLFFMLLTVAITTQAQSDVTTFLGIPVDGTKSEMIRKLKAKGFKEVRYLEGTLEGEFNGRDVYVSVGTNNNKVYRICLYDKNTTTEASIRIRFNTLCDQFARNPKYAEQEYDFLSENEKIGYGISVEHKRYQASFYQKKDAKSVDIGMLDRVVWFMISEDLGSFRIVMYYDNMKNQANGDDL